MTVVEKNFNGMKKERIKEEKCECLIERENERRNKSRRRRRRRRSRKKKRTTDEGVGNKKPHSVIVDNGRNEC